MLRSIPKPFAEKIAEKRKILGISQIDLGKQIGVSQAVYHRIEQAKTRVDLEVIKKLCEVLGIDVSEALTPDQVKKSEQKEGYRTIPEYNVRFSTGHGEFQGIEEIKQNLQMPKIFSPENGQVSLVRVEADL
jgi:transcriptional regulator with XRE-family HTH domain